MSEDEFRPPKIDDEIIFISNYYIPIKQIGCYLDTDGIINYWQRLENEGFPVVQISSLLVELENIHRKKKDMFFLFPFPMHIIRMVDAIHCAEFIKRGKQRINLLKKQLCSLITESITFPERQRVTSEKILETVITVSDEFRIGYVLQGLKPTLRFNNWVQFFVSMYNDTIADNNNYFELEEVRRYILN